jgi:uncharacterized protein (TIGR03067 family)
VAVGQAWPLGRRAGELNERKRYFVFEGARLAMSSEVTGKSESAEVTALDPSTDPKCLDLTKRRPNRPDQVTECVYQIDGDTLRLALADPEGEKLRPAGFDKPTDPRVLVWTLKRVKE